MQFLKIVMRYRFDSDYLPFYQSILRVRFLLPSLLAPAKLDSSSQFLVQLFVKIYFCKFKCLKIIANGLVGYFKTQVQIIKVEIKIKE